MKLKHNKQAKIFKLCVMILERGEGGVGGVLLKFGAFKVISGSSPGNLKPKNLKTKDSY